MGASTSSPPSVRRHHWIVRLTHWATVIVLAGMIASGLQIYEAYARFGNRGGPYFVSPFDGAQFPRSEEHTSELQSHSDLVCRLLLEKKKKHKRSRKYT